MAQDDPSVQDAGDKDDKGAAASTTVDTTNTADTQKPTGVVSDKPDSTIVDDDEGKTFTADYVRRLREENAKHRTSATTASQRAAELEAEVTELRRAKMTEDERLQDELKELRDTKLPTLLQRNRELTVEVLATKIGIVDPDVAVKLIDWSNIDTTDKEAVEAQLAALVEKRPYLKKVDATVVDKDDSTVDEDKKPKTPKKTATTTSTANPPADKNNGKRSFSRSEIRAMTPEQINELYASGELKEAMAEGRITQD